MHHASIHRARSAPAGKSKRTRMTVLGMVVTTRRRACTIDFTSLDPNVVLHIALAGPCFPASEALLLPR